MPPCISPFLSFRQVIEAGHPFVPRHADAVEGLHFPGARPIHPPDAGLPSHGNDPATSDSASDESSGDEDPQPTEDLGADVNANAAAAQVQGPAHHGPMGNPPANANADADADAHGVEAIIKEKISTLVIAFRRLFPVMLVERWLRRAIQDQ